MRQSEATQNPPDGAAMNVDTVGLGQFGNQLIKRDLTFAGDARIYPTAHPRQRSMSAAIPSWARHK